MRLQGLVIALCMVLGILVGTRPLVALAPLSGPDSLVLDSRSTIAQDEEHEYRIHVTEEEAVGNWSIDENFHARTDWGGLWIGVDSEAHLTRSFMKFDLSHISRDVSIESARLVGYMSGALGLEDVPIAVHYSENDTWSETTVTWRNQPEFNEIPADVIDSPDSPDMFVKGNWYSWDITEEVLQTLDDDKTLSLVLKLTDEFCPAPRGAVFTEDEYHDKGESAHFNATYVSILEHVPEAKDLSVNGESDGMLIHYLQDPSPVLAWQMNDLDQSDFQADFECEIYDYPLFEGSPLWSVGHSSLYRVMPNSSSSTLEPFSRSQPVRIQYKYSSQLLNTSGTVDRVRFDVITNETEVTFTDLVITLANTHTGGDLSSAFLSNYGSATQVEVLRHETYAAPINNGSLVFDVANFFTLSFDLNLIIEIRYTNCSGGDVFSAYTSGTGLGSAAYTWGPSAYEGETALFLYPYCFGMNLEIASEFAMGWNSSSQTSASPFGLPSNSSGTFQTKINGSLFSESGSIDRVMFHVNSTDDSFIFENLTVVLAESDLSGPLNHSDFSSNYDILTATVVVEEHTTKLWNHGGLLLMEVDNEFHYSGTRDIVLELSWDALSGDLGVFISEQGYSAWNYSNLIVEGNDNESWCPQIGFDFIHSDPSVQYEEGLLPERQFVYWRVRVRDSTGIWSDWGSHSFRYYPIASGPSYSGLTVTPDPVSLLEPVSICINATFVLGIEQVIIEVEDSNHTMAQVTPNSYEYTVYPTRTGSIPFRIYLESTIGTWNSTLGWIHVQETETSTSTGTTTHGTYYLPYIMIAGAVTIVTIGAAALVRRKRSANNE